ncbi:MAG: HAMP domain-containing protein [Anaerolineales bacterium]|nr:HAMP domain-containing protein [Anaerolineales bacterium]
MSIQNRLLLIYTSIFSTAFLLVALLVYFLPLNRILMQTDRELDEVAQQVVALLGPGTMARLTVPEDLADFKTATTFITVIDRNGTIVARSSNLFDIDAVLDPEARGTEKTFNLVQHDDVVLRVLTVPVVDRGDGATILGYLQVARVLDSYEDFNRALILALLIGFGAATASLFLAVWITPGLFRPLDDIATVARQITRTDDLSRRVPDSGRNDEFGDLARALNQTLEQIERLFQAQQRLLADVSHELRTPLTTIRGNLDLMRHMGVADPESMDVIQDELERMTRLIGDLLLLARADSGGLPLDRKPVELDTVLFEVHRQVSRLPKAVEVTLGELDQVTVLGDADRLKQLLLILVDNAVKYTPAGGRVTLNLARSDGWARLSVCDTGSGIPAGDIPHIFDRFYRVDKARNRAQGGAGLGLAIAKWIVQAHGGVIRVESQVGVGTTFTITLPARKPPPEVLEEEAEKTPTGGIRPSLRAFSKSRKLIEDQ